MTFERWVSKSRLLFAKLKNSGLTDFAKVFTLLPSGTLPLLNPDEQYRSLSKSPKPFIVFVNNGIPGRPNPCRKCFG